jgi:hypothetical protein
VTRSDQQNDIHEDIAIPQRHSGTSCFDAELMLADIEREHKQRRLAWRWTWPHSDVPHDSDGGSASAFVTPLSVPLRRATRVLKRRMVQCQPHPARRPRRGLTVAIRANI